MIRFQEGRKTEAKIAAKIRTEGHKGRIWIGESR
jgi:hypothetical protein